MFHVERRVLGPWTPDGGRATVGGSPAREPWAGPARGGAVARKTIDCRKVPSGTDCTVTISGEEHEVLDLAVAQPWPCTVTPTATTCATGSAG